MIRRRGLLAPVICLLVVLVFASTAPSAAAIEGGADPASRVDASGRAGKGSVASDLGAERLSEEPVGWATGRGFRPRGTVASAFQVDCSNPDNASHPICTGELIDGDDAEAPETPTATPTPTPTPTPDLRAAEWEAYLNAKGEAVDWINDQQFGFDTAPPPRTQIVHLRNFMWIHEGNAAPVFDDEREGVRVTVSATPVSSLWRLEEMLTGRTYEYSCAGLGHPYNGNPDEVSLCGHTFDHSSEVVGDVALTVAVGYELKVTSTLTGSASNFSPGEVVAPSVSLGAALDFDGDAVSKPFEFPLWVNEVMTWGIDEMGVAASPDVVVGPIIPEDEGYSCGIKQKIVYYGTVGIPLHALGVSCGDAFGLLDTLKNGVLACAGGITDSIGETIDLLVGAVTDPVGTVKDGIAGIQALIDMARNDPGAFASTVALEALGIPADEWEAAAGDTGARTELVIGGICRTAFEILAGGAAKKIFNLLPPGRRPSGTPEADLTPDRPDTDVPETSKPDRPRVCTISSFPTGTPVRMASGDLVPIEDVRAGDEVLAGDPATGEWTAQRVLHQWSYVDTDHMTTATLVDGTSVTATDHHLFWVDSAAMWTELQFVSVGDQLLTPDGRVTVSDVVTHPQAETLVWELDTSGPDTFTVHTNSVDLLVHNANRCELSEAEIDHILDGDADGGFHFREGGVDPDGARFIKKRPPSKLGMHPDSPWQGTGVYKAKVEVEGDLSPDGTQRAKDSTFFPDDWDRQDVIDAIETALPNKGEGVLNKDGTARIFRGISEDGFPITIVEDLDGNLLTAYPDVTMP